MFIKNKYYFQIINFYNFKNFGKVKKFYKTNIFII